jgi:uncharacterized surface protein with fasciclin (FAS1) repeats
MAPTAQKTPDELEKEYEQLAEQLKPTTYNKEYAGKTLYQFLVDDKASLNFLNLLHQCPQLLSTTQDANSEYTIFLPTAQSWEDGRDYKNAASKEIEELISMHISPHYVTTKGFLHMPNVPMLLRPSHSNGPQIVRARASSGGRWELNHSTHVTEENIVCSNGVIHRVDQVLVPPSGLLAVMERNGLHAFRRAGEATGAFSAFLAGARGGTVFAPTDEAFAALGRPVSEFLLEAEGGLPYLRALIRLHLVPDLTMFGNLIWPKNDTGARQTSRDEGRRIKGRLTQTLPTSLRRAGQPVDIAVTIVRCNALISLYANGTASVVGQDLATSDGVVQAIDEVLLPYEKEAGKGDAGLSLEEFKDLLAPFVEA